MNLIYLDYAAATPMDPAVQAAMLPYFSDRFYNPSATYMAAIDVRRDLEAARSKIASVIGARSSEIVFTAGGTEANNLAIRGVMQQFPEGNLIVSAIEHESVLRTAHEYDCHEARVDTKGIIDVPALLAGINDKTVLISVMYANNEVGSVQPIHQISLGLEAIRRERQRVGNELPLYLHTDAAQAAAYLDVHASRLGADFITFNGGKIYGPKQFGVLFVRAQARFKPQITGGGQERGLRSGTENVAGAIGFAKALELVQLRRHDEVARLQRLQRLFFDLVEEKIPHAIINGSQKNRLPNNVHITLPDTDNERILIQLDEAGILCAAGSACSASNEEPSHVLKAMGISEQDAQSSLRFSMGHGTTEEAIRKTVATLTSLLYT
ncbi:MAG TPA: cysteine desulfurase family protein [Candidatus Saccharimonadales bacterium]